MLLIALAWARDCGAPASAPGLPPLRVAVPALVRTTSPEASAGAAATYLGLDTNAAACIGIGGRRIAVPPSAVGILPFYATRQVDDSVVPTLVLGATVDPSGAPGLRVDDAGAFSPQRRTRVVGAWSVDLAVPAAPLVLGDLPLGALWLGTNDDGTLVALTYAPVSVRGLALPIGVLVHVEEGKERVLADAELRRTEIVGGLALPPHTRLQFAQGCDIALLLPGSLEAACLAIQQGHLVAESLPPAEGQMPPGDAAAP